MYIRKERPMINSREKCADNFVYVDYGDFVQVRLSKWFYFTRSGWGTGKEREKRVEVYTKARFPLGDFFRASDFRLLKLNRFLISASRELTRQKKKSLRAKKFA